MIAQQQPEFISRFVYATPVGAVDHPDDARAIGQILVPVFSQRLLPADVEHIEHNPLEREPPGFEATRRRNRQRAAADEDLEDRGLARVVKAEEDKFPRCPFAVARALESEERQTIARCLLNVFPGPHIE
jgi:hypothetical protein